MEIGTLKELDVKPGDVLGWHKAAPGYEHLDDRFAGVDDLVVTKYGSVRSKSIGRCFGANCCHIFRIVSRASDTPKLWRDMTDAEKGALLLAHHEGKVIEYFHRMFGEWRPFGGGSPDFLDTSAYRVKPEPVRKTFTLENWVSMNGTDHMGAFTILDCQIYPYDVKGKTTIETVDGKPVKVVWEADSQS